MTAVTLRPNTVHNTPDSVTGAGAFGSATNDDSDASYGTILATGDADAAVGFTTTTLPSGAVVLSLTPRVRARYQVGQGIFNFLLGSATNNAEYSANYWTDLTTSFVTRTGTVHEDSMTQSEVDGIRAEFLNGGVGSDRYDIAEIYADLVYVTKPTTTVDPISNVTGYDFPQVTWTQGRDADTEGGQYRFQVKLFNDAQYGAGGFDPTTSAAVLSSGSVTSTGTSYDVATLIPQDTYRMYVRTSVITNGVEQWSDWDFEAFTSSHTLDVPSSVTPADSVTVDTSRPAIGATIGVQTDAVLVAREWQVASNVGFSTDLQTFQDAGFSTSKSGTIPWPFGNRIAAGTWYLRCRTVNEFDEVSAWSSTNTITVTLEPDTEAWTPSGTVSVEYPGDDNVTLAWNFTDPNDNSNVQTAYEVELWKLSAPGSPLQSTKTTSAVGSHTFTVDNTWKDTQLAWRVRVYDIDDTVSPWSGDQGFFLRDLPVANITAPVGVGGATEPNPTVTWTFSAAQTTQLSYRVVVTNTDTQVVVADSGTVISTDTSWVIPTPVVTPLVTYQIDLTLVDSASLVGTDTDTFTASYTLPTTPAYSINLANYSTNGSITIDWTSATEDVDFVGWHVYRRNQGDVTWVQVFTTADANVRAFTDWTTPSNTVVEYAVVQEATVSTVDVESAYPIQVILAETDSYFLIVQDQGELSLRLQGVTADSFEDEQEQQTLNLRGRGRQVQQGTRYGYTGTLNVNIFDRPTMTGKEQRDAIEAIRDSGLPITFKSPFGDTFVVALGSATFTRQSGVGIKDIGTMSIDYQELSGA